MASKKNIFLWQTKANFNPTSVQNSRKPFLFINKLRTQPFTLYHRQTPVSNYVSSNIFKSNTYHYQSGSSSIENDLKTCDNYDKVDRHVSLGQESNKHEEADDFDEIKCKETHNDPKQFQPKNILILSKLSRYQFEKQQHAKDMSEDEFRKILENRGSDYTLIKYYHNVHKSVEEKIVRAIEKRGLQVKICQRTNYCDNLAEWADLIVTAGGDGTFLLGASKIKNRDKPIIGINTDPTRSEGHLCLPKHWSLNVDDAVQALLDGKFRWKYRRRLRLTLTGQHNKIYAPVMELYSQQLQYPEYRYLDTQDHELLREQQAVKVPTPTETTENSKCFNNSENKNLLDKESKCLMKSIDDEISSRTLPILALNEVFIGESLSSRVSYILVKFDNDSTFLKTRNSGMIVSTGTGSTSWTYNVNKLTHQSVEDILRIIFETTGKQINFKDPSVIQLVTNRFNKDIKFDAELNIMAYTIRDPITMGLTSSTSTSSPGLSDIRETNIVRKPRGKASRINVKSKCFDAHLVVDGALSYKFDDGTDVVIEIKDEDALKTVEIINAEL